MPIYTKKGDRGQTGLFDGTRVAKDDVRIEAIGTVDELNTIIGLVVAEIKEKKEERRKKEVNIKRLKEDLENIQKDLFGIGAGIAGYRRTKDEIMDKRYEIKDRKTENGKMGLEERTIWMEEEIDRMWKEMPALSNFILPGGSLAGAQLHLARAVCRRTERNVVRLVKAVTAVTSVTGYEAILKYLNRLSDYLFCLARRVNYWEGDTETVWKG